MKLTGIAKYFCFYHALKLFILLSIISISLASEESWRRKQTEVKTQNANINLRSRETEENEDIKQVYRYEAHPYIPEEITEQSESNDGLRRKKDQLSDLNNEATLGTSSTPENYHLVNFSNPDIIVSTAAQNDLSTFSNEISTFTFEYQNNGTLSSGVTETESISYVSTISSTPTNEDNFLSSSCLKSLDLEHGTGTFIASDFSPGYLPDAARLNSQTGWVGGLSLVHYIQVDLKQIWNIAGLLLQTHAQWPKNFIEEFQVLYSEDGIHWNKLRTNNDESRFKTNYTSLNSMHVFRFPVKAQYIIINPTRWSGNPGPALRMELFGCNVDNPFSEPIVPRDVKGDIMIDTIWEAGVPYLVKDMIKVATGVTLTLRPGVEIYFADRLAGIVVEGILISEGTMELPVLLQSRELLSLLIARPFWKGIMFFHGGSQTKSKLRYTKITSAGVGVLTVANAVEIENTIFENCDCGIRIESGTQLVPELIWSSTFTGNNYGIQLYNISGIIKLSDISFYDHKVTAISGNLHDNYPVTTFLNLTIQNIQIKNASYGIYLTNYKSTELFMHNIYISDCDYGVYLELSDGAMSINTTIKDSVFTDNKLYGLLVDFRHLARFNPYLSIGNFKTTVLNSIFNDSTNGFSYFSPEVFRNYQSVLEIDSCIFQGLQVGLMLQMYEQSSFKIVNSKFSENSVKVIDITYSALDIDGEVKNNSIFQNSAEAFNYEESEMNINTDKGSLFRITANGDSAMHGKLSVIGNDVRDNSYPCSIVTSLIGLHLSSNVFGNPNSNYELCINFLWIPGSKVLNASYNWWGSPNLINASQKIYDFFYDMDLGLVNISPILREPRVLGASWDNASHTLTSENNIANGGIVTGTITISLKSTVIISSSIYIPHGSSLHLIGNVPIQFGKNRGILVEGKLHLEGQANDSFILTSQNDLFSWKGLKMMHSESTLLQNVAVTKSRGLQYVGTVPLLQSVSISDSYEAGLSVVVVQPSAISIENSQFDNNTHGMLLDIQGNSSSKLNLNITNCMITNNHVNGILIESQNIISLINISKTIFKNNYGKGFNITLTDGYIILEENIFNNSESVTAEGGRIIDIQFVGTCVNYPIPSRQLKLYKNTIYEETSSLVTSRVLIKTTCINVPAIWDIENNIFINNIKMDITNSFITFEMPNNLYPWPLTLKISNNSFTCFQNSMSALIMNVNHGENVVIEGNQIEHCYYPLQVQAQNFRHNLTVARNLFRNNGPIVLQGPINERISSSFLNFSYNELINSGNISVIQTSGYNASLHFNFFENPNTEYDLWVGDLSPVNATYNWWGTADFNKILSRVSDGRLDFRRAEATLFPCLLSKNYTNVSTPYPDVFQVMDNIIGGSVQGNVTLPFSNKPYEVKYPIRVPPGSSLTISGGNTLLFHNNTGIYANGDLQLDGNETAPINLKPASSTKVWKGITIGQPRKEFMKVRLNGSSLPFAGRVEIFSSGVWLDVCSEHFGMTEGHVVCKELGFVDVHNVSSVNSMQNHYGMTNVKCIGLEMSLWDCDNNNGKNIMCNTYKAATVTCKTSFLGARKKRETGGFNGTELHLSSLKYVNILEADIGLQINNDNGIELRNINVLHSKGPGILLNSGSNSEISLEECTVNSGGDIGVDIQGSNVVSLHNCNITENFLDALTISTEFVNSSVSLLSCEISGNGGNGVLITTNSIGFVNISQSQVKLNGQMGAKILSGSVSFFKSLIEEHPEGGAEVNISGSLHVLNSAFSTNGGTDLNIIINAKDSSSSALSFERSGFVNSFGSMSRAPKQFVINASILSEDNSNNNNTFPITFFDCQILDTYSDAILISAPYKILNMSMKNTTFEHINGIAIQLISLLPPELEFHFNKLIDIRNSFLVINSTTQ